MSDYLTYLLDLLQELPNVTARRMFGGHGIFRDGLMFGLVADDTLYFKTDDQTRSDYEKRGLGPFLYSKKGKQVSLAYYQVPEEALESSDEMTRWARQAIDVALRAASKKSAKPTP